MRSWPFLLTYLLTVHSVHGQELRETLFKDAEAALSAAREADAPLLAPETFSRGLDRYGSAEDDLARGRNLDRIRGELADAVDRFTEAAEFSEIARITLAALIKTRDDAANANAESFAVALWSEGEEMFSAAVRRLELGDIRGARSRAQEAEDLYRDAELTAIKAQYLSQTRALLAQAEQARVPRYAPITFAKAQSLLQQAERELNDNRYDTDLPRSLAQQANYEARHAIYLSEQILRMRDQDRSEEDIILTYEDPLNRIAAAADKVAQLDAGVDPLVIDLVAYIEDLREQFDQSELDLEDGRIRIAELEDEIRDLDEQLGGVSQERVALVQRFEAEARIREQFQTIEVMFTREEARVSREGNNIILRLVGLTFESGEATVDARYRNLLGKVGQAATVFPRSQIVIEGHTDAYGSDEANLLLSRERAEAISSYLSSQLAVAAFRISAIGYGETRPIANNETPQGRLRNRRIDIRIEPQLE